jgi:hypothetical protein
MILCVEGNIGAGKSSVLSLLKQLFRLDPTVLFVDEPVSLWESSGMLKGMYDGALPKSTFQLAALMTRTGALMRALAVPGANCSLELAHSPLSLRPHKILLHADGRSNSNSVGTLCWDHPSVQRETHMGALWVAGNPPGCWQRVTLSLGHEPKKRVRLTKPQSVTF